MFAKSKIGGYVSCAAVVYLLFIIFLWGFWRGDYVSKGAGIKKCKEAKQKKPKADIDIKSFRKTVSQQKTYVSP